LTYADVITLLKTILQMEGSKSWMLSQINLDLLI